MTTYKITDPETGEALYYRGDSKPTKEQIGKLFFEKRTAKQQVEAAGQKAGPKTISERAFPFLEAVEPITSALDTRRAIDATTGTLLVAALLVILVVRRWKRISVELSLIDWRGMRRVFIEWALLLVVAVFAAGFLTSLRGVESEAFWWVAIGFPVCVQLTRYWLRHHR